MRRLLMVVLFAMACAEREPAARDTSPSEARAIAAPDAYVARGACPFECCVYGRWTVQTLAVLRAAPTIGADSLGTLAPGTTISADSGLVRVNPTGLAVVTGAVPHDMLHDTIQLRPGDTLELLDYEGEGYRNVRWKGRAVTLMEYWDTTGSRGVTLLRKPVSQWWVHATAGQVRGWVLMDSVRVKGADRCAGPV